jgi:thiol-disulfide isomerase/thioredoxin
MTGHARLTIRGVLVLIAAIACVGCTGGGATIASGTAGAVVTEASQSPTPSPRRTAAPTPTPTPSPTPKPTPASTATPQPPAAAATPATRDWLYDPTRDARADVLAAIAAAKANDRLVLVDFGADWCPDCHVLAEYFSRPAAKAILDSTFEVVAVDVGLWDHNLDVVEDYGNAIWVGIPSLVVLDANGKVLRSTADGSIASAASMSEEQVLTILRALAQ